MTIASGRINSQSKHDLICHVAKVKATRSAYLLFPSNLTLKPKKNIYIPQNKEHNICNIVRVFMFQQRLE